MKIDELELEIVSKGKIREFTNWEKTSTVCDFTVKDGSGEITMTLWGEDIEKFEVGDKILLTNGFATEFAGVTKIGRGKYGNVEKIEEE